MKLIEFIKAHEDWEELLAAPPYFVKTKRDDGYIIFSYNQIFSDFDIELVRECRGVILREADLKPVCVPFYKFGNYGESYVPSIDWKSARVQDKIDGSLIKVWHDGKWRVSTSGNIDANKSDIGRTDLFEDDCPYNSFGELFEAARTAAGLDYDKLDKNNTYMFELIGPYNKVIIYYPEIDIYHIGTRDNRTLEELDVDIGIKKPREHSLGTLDDCVAAAAHLPKDKEGYVVVDKHYNRVKIKNPTYVALHYLKGNGDPNLAKLVWIVRNNETEEFLTYFPELKSKIVACKTKIDAILSEMEETLRELDKRTFETQKDYALAVKNNRLSKFYFDRRKDPSLTPAEWFWLMSDDKIKSVLEGM